MLFSLIFIQYNTCSTSYKTIKCDCSTIKPECISFCSSKDNQRLNETFFLDTLQLSKKEEQTIDAIIFTKYVQPILRITQDIEYLQTKSASLDTHNRKKILTTESVDSKSEYKLSKVNTIVTTIQKPQNIATRAPTIASSMKTVWRTPKQLFTQRIYATTNKILDTAPVDNKILQPITTSITPVYAQNASFSTVEDITLPATLPLQNTPGNDFGNALSQNFTTVTNQTSPFMFDNILTDVPYTINGKQGINNLEKDFSILSSKQSQKSFYNQFRSKSVIKPGEALPEIMSKKIAESQITRTNEVDINKVNVQIPKVVPSKNINPKNVTQVIAMPVELSKNNRITKTITKTIRNSTSLTLSSLKTECAGGISFSKVFVTTTITPYITMLTTEYPSVSYLSITKTIKENDLLSIEYGTEKSIDHLDNSSISIPKRYISGSKHTKISGRNSEFLVQNGLSDVGDFSLENDYNDIAPYSISNNIYIRPDQDTYDKSPKYEGFDNQRMQRYTTITVFSTSTPYITRFYTEYPVTSYKTITESFTETPLETIVEIDKRTKDTWPSTITKTITVTVHDPQNHTGTTSTNTNIKEVLEKEENSKRYDELNFSNFTKKMDVNDNIENTIQNSDDLLPNEEKQEKKDINSGKQCIEYDICQSDDLLRSKMTSPQKADKKSKGDEAETKIIGNPSLKHDITKTNKQSYQSSLNEKETSTVYITILKATNSSQSSTKLTNQETRLSTVTKIDRKPDDNTKTLDKSDKKESKDMKKLQQSIEEQILSSISVIAKKSDLLSSSKIEYESSVSVMLSKSISEFLAKEYDKSIKNLKSMNNSESVKRKTLQKSLSDAKLSDKGAIDEVKDIKKAQKQKFSEISAKIKSLENLKTTKEDEKNRTVTKTVTSTGLDTNENVTNRKPSIKSYNNQKNIESTKDKITPTTVTKILTKTGINTEVTISEENSDSLYSAVADMEFLSSSFGNEERYKTENSTQSNVQLYKPDENNVKTTDFETISDHRIILENNKDPLKDEETMGDQRSVNHTDEIDDEEKYNGTGDVSTADNKKNNNGNKIMSEDNEVGHESGTSVSSTNKSIEQAKESSSIKSRYEALKTLASDNLSGSNADLHANTTNEARIETYTSTKNSKNNKDEATKLDFDYVKSLFMDIFDLSDASSKAQKTADTAVHSSEDSEACDTVKHKSIDLSTIVKETCDKNGNDKVTIDEIHGKNIISSLMHNKERTETEEKNEGAKDDSQTCVRDDFVSLTISSRVDKEETISYKPLSSIKREENNEINTDNILAITTTTITKPKIDDTEDDDYAQKIKTMDNTNTYEESGTSVSNESELELLSEQNISQNTSSECKTETLASKVQTNDIIISENLTTTEQSTATLYTSTLMHNKKDTNLTKTYTSQNKNRLNHKTTKKHNAKTEESNDKSFFEKLIDKGYNMFNETSSTSNPAKKSTVTQIKLAYKTDSLYVFNTNTNNFTESASIITKTKYAKLNDTNDRIDKLSSKISHFYDMLSEKMVSIETLNDKAYISKQITEMADLLYSRLKQNNIITTKSITKTYTTKASTSTVLSVSVKSITIMKEKKHTDNQNKSHSLIQKVTEKQMTASETMLIDKKKVKKEPINTSSCTTKTNVPFFDKVKDKFGIRSANKETISSSFVTTHKIDDVNSTKNQLNSKKHTKKTVIHTVYEFRKRNGVKTINQSR